MLPIDFELLIYFIYSDRVAVSNFFKNFISFFFKVKLYYNTILKWEQIKIQILNNKT